MATRQNEPANGCKASKEELLNKKKNPLDIDDDCPMCEKLGVLCFVASHPSRLLLPSPAGDSQLLEKIYRENQVIIQENRKVARMLTSVSKVIVQDSCPRAPSGTTERNYHQAEMKRQARVRYECIHPTDPFQTKCMLLESYFPTNQVVCSHIIALRNRSALSRVGLTDECIWDARNCLLIHEALEKKIEDLEVTFLLNPMTQTYSFQVLYDDLLPKSIPVPASSIFNGRSGNLTYNDLNGRALSLPPLVFPYRRCLYFTSYFAYLTAMQSRRAHSCAEASNPSEDVWEVIKRTVVTDSECGDELAFLSLNEEENEVIDESSDFAEK